MGHEELHDPAVDGEQPVEYIIECIDKFAGEDSDQSQYGHNACNHTLSDILKSIPTEHEECYRGYEEYRCHDRGEFQAETSLVGFSHDLAGGRISLLHAGCEGSGLTVVIFVWLKEEGAESRRKRKSVDSRQTDGHGHRQTELTVEYARSAAKERYRNKHKHHHQRDRDQRTGNLTHRVD